MNSMRDRLIKLLCGVKCEGGEEIGNCPQRRDGKCRTVQKLEMCQIGAIADHLIANGVIVPPCNIGQPVWRLCNRTVKDVEICEGKVSMIQQKSDKSWKFRVSIDGSVRDFSTEDLGKFIFLTQEEAEQALKGECHD